MTEAVEDWQTAFRYGPNPDAVDCYYVFAPLQGSPIELFQLDVMLAHGEVLRGGITVVTTDGQAHRIERTSNDGAQVERDPHAFRLDVEGLFTLSSGAPDRFRIEAADHPGGLQIDLEVCPDARHTWPVKGYSYFTTLDSTIRGTITIDGTSVGVAGRTAFEHATYDEAQDGPPIQLPPFWHYEYVAWDAENAPFGSILWNLLDEAGEQIDQTGIGTSGPLGASKTFDSFDLTYSDVHEHDGILLPRTWEVHAANGDETFAYRSNVRHVASSTPRGEGFLVSFVLDCEGVHHGPAGSRQFTGIGRSEYINWTLNPVELG